MTAFLVSVYLQKAEDNNCRPCIVRSQITVQYRVRGRIFNAFDVLRAKRFNAKWKL